MDGHVTLSLVTLVTASVRGSGRLRRADWLYVLQTRLDKASRIGSGIGGTGGGEFNRSPAIISWPDTAPYNRRELLEVGNAVRYSFCLNPRPAGGGGSKGPPVVFRK